MDWQYQKEEKQIQGVFFHNGKMIKTFIAWPLSSLNSTSETSVNTCQCIEDEDSENEQNADEPAASCEHIAALAIESKTRLDRLPQSLKQTETYHSEWQYLTAWLSQQTYDPFPNMARHRVIYLLDGEADNITVTVHKAYLTQQNEYQAKAELELSLVAKDKLPKFVSLTDQQIIHQMNQIKIQHKDLALAKNGLILIKDGETGTELHQQAIRQLLKRIVLSGRCFWRSARRNPLTFENASKFKDDWWYIGEQLFLDRAKSRLVDIAPIINETVESFLEITSQPDSHWQPCLTMSSEQIVLPWTKQSIEIDVAKVSFCTDKGEASIEVTLEDLMTYVYHTSKRNNSVILESIAQKIHQIDWLQSVFSNFEQPVCQHFDICDRFLDGNFAHWLPLFRGLELEGWKISFEQRFRLNQKRVDRWYSKISRSQELKNKAAVQGTSSQQLLQPQTDWFDLEVGIKIDGRSINLMPYIIKSLHQGIWDFTKENENTQPDNLYLTLDDGTRVELAYDRIKNILNTLLELYETKPLTEENKLRLPSTQFARLLNLQEQTGEDTEWQETEWLKQKAESLNNGKGIVNIDVPQNVKATLRDYQREGLNWLQFLAKEELSGILADDMGLGKTLQTLSHIQIEKNNGRMKGPCLVVAPTSLLGNWFSEAAKFTPELKLVYWAGSKRHLSQGDLAGADLIITSYGLLLRDFELFNQQNIHLLILDEAQAIKNSRSKVSKIAFSLHSKQRLCLSGTPLENHLGELWSLFHFLMPGFLGDESQFKKLFRIPIEKEHDYERQKELADRIAPFMLRRTKDKVAKDLPDKTTIEEIIDLTESQADIYETVRLSMFEEVQKAVALSNTGASSGKNQLLIGNALLRLRQICCHPKLISHKLAVPEPVATQTYQQADLFTEPQTEALPETPAETKITSSINNADSAKLTWLKTTLPEMIQNGRKILIFSSFTSMLKIIKELLNELSIKHLSLTGKTKNRTELVEKFQTGNIPVFLISLKAGGSGLNLTEADTVIHYDPWWNPAAENQASDRAHRIGQDKPVFVYKLITKGTVEERINQMQQQKSMLAEELYKRNEKQSKVERPDWVSLLAPLDLNED
jgi:non-specific serine/threonine protein kinase